MTVYSLLIDPGHPQAHYQDAALRIVPWTTRIAGPILFLAAMWWWGRREGRNPFRFAAVAVVAYLIIDGAMVGFREMLTPAVGLTLFAKTVGALIGAALAARDQRGYHASASDAI